MAEMIVDVILDSLKTFAFVFVFTFGVSFFENKLANLLEKNRKIAPILGSLFGSVPQCGVSVVSADLYTKKHISLGTLIAIFISCSDEALPVLFSDVSGKWYMGFVLLGIKISLAIVVGYIMDVIMRNKLKEIESHHEHCHGETEIHIGCCNHTIESKDESFLHTHLIHPLIHSLKVFGYVLGVNFLFGLLIYYVGEETISGFLQTNKYITPLIATLIGLIPNCASSVLVTQSYVIGNIPFSAMLAGLIVNAGLGIMVLFKKPNQIKNTLMILGVLITISIAAGYIFLFI